MYIMCIIIIISMIVIIITMIVALRSGRSSVEEDLAASSTLGTPTITRHA